MTKSGIMQALRFWKEVYTHLNMGQRVFVAMVAENTKGSPGTPGAKYMVSGDESLFGTIGGGKMEFELTERAHAVLKDGAFQPEVQTLVHRRTGEGDKSGMICAGSQTNIYCVCEPERDIPLIGQLISLLENDQPGHLNIGPDGFAVDSEENDPHRPIILLKQGEDDDWSYSEQLLNRKRIALIGGGHCAVALCHTMVRLDYEVFIFDTREDVFTLREVTDARAVKIVEDYSEAGPMISYPELTCAVVMTSDFVSDCRGLLGVVNLPFPFIGLMGSKTKIHNIREKLLEEGVDEARLDALYAPIGLPMDSDTPEEIAISVAGQILQERNLGEKFL